MSRVRIGTILTRVMLAECPFSGNHGGAMLESGHLLGYFWGMQKLDICLVPDAMA